MNRPSSATSYNSDPAAAEPDSDVYALLNDKMISVTPISLDMTSRTDMFRLTQIMLGKIELRQQRLI